VSVEREDNYRMKYLLYSLLILTFLLMSFEKSFPEINGLWVAQKVDERDIGEDASLQMNMILIDSKGRERKRNLYIIRKNLNGNDKLLLEFTFPNDIKGTSLLIWEHKGEDNERFLYLPALGRIRRIATREKDENFAGTDFSYEDISGRKLEEYTYELIKDEIIFENQKCYLLASYPKEINPKFPKILSWIKKDSFVVIKGEYYNKKREVEKTFKVSKLEKIDGIWTSLEFQMENHKMNHKTFSIVTEVKYNQGIPEQRFEKSELER